MGSYFWEYYHFDYIFVILIRENSRFGSTPRILLSITDPTHNWLLAPAPPSVETPGTGEVGLGIGDSKLDKLLPESWMRTH